MTINRSIQITKIENMLAALNKKLLLHTQCKMLGIYTDQLITASQ